jgi:hypothetical protein
MAENIFTTLKNHVTNKATALTNIVTEADMSSVVSKDGINMSKFSSKANRMVSSLKNWKDGISTITKSNAGASFVNASGTKDWRVKLSFPAKWPTPQEGDLMAPLEHSGGLVYPTNPTVMIQQHAEYNSLQPVHTNYPYWAYQNSSVGRITITGQFYVQNAMEARYWVACIHYLRCVTKMHYGGNTPDAGSPPPRVKFNAYGDHIFNNVPVIVQDFTFDSPADVDYISCGYENSRLSPGAMGGKIDAEKVSYAPTMSLLTISIVPQYTRKEISEFNFNDFIKGNYNSGNNRGFI